MYNAVNTLRAAASILAERDRGTEGTSGEAEGSLIPVPRAGSAFFGGGPQDLPQIARIFQKRRGCFLATDAHRCTPIALAVLGGSVHAMVRLPAGRQACQAGYLPGWSAVATALRASSIAASVLPTFCVRPLLDSVVLSLIELDGRMVEPVSAKGFAILKPKNFKPEPSAPQRTTNNE